MKKFHNKYRIDSSRCSKWNYGWNGSYFITINTAHMKHFFGHVANAKMINSEIGNLANKFWLEIPDHFPFVKLDAHQIMPNHIHGIKIIDKNGISPNMDRAQTPNLGVSTPHIPLPKTAAATKNWKPNTLGSIINQYKRFCTIQARKINPDFGWHPRFHDHIIRDTNAIQRIRHYILNNPKNWQNNK